MDDKMKTKIEQECAAKEGAPMLHIGTEKSAVEEIHALIKSILGDNPDVSTQETALEILPELLRTGNVSIANTSFNKHFR